MATIGLVADNLGVAETTNVVSVLQTFGHVVTQVLQSAFTSTTFTGASVKDLVVVARSSRDDATFVANLDAHMTAGVPVIVLRSGGLTNPGDVGRNVSDAPDTTASALGLISLERRTASATRADPVVLRTESRQEFVTSGFLPTADHFVDDEILVTKSAGDWWTELPATVKLDGSVVQTVGQWAGKALLDTADGFVALTAAEAGDARVGARTGATFPTRALWFGVGGTVAWGTGAATILNAAVNWVQGSVGTFPTTGTNGVVMARIDLSPLKQYDSSTITWTETIPANTTLAIQTSVDDGATFQTATNGSAIPNLVTNQSLVSVVMLVKVVLSTTDATVTSSLDSLSLAIKGSFPSLRDASDVERPAEYYLNGQVVWKTGNNKGLAMEIKSWDPAGETIKLFRPMELTIAAGDQIEVRAGCLKRLFLDCRDKFNNVVNFRGEPFIPGSDQLTRFPDSQGQR